MSDSDIEKAVKEAAEFEAQDKKRKEAIEARNEADSFVFQTEKALNEVGDKVPESDKTQVQADLEAVKAILERTKDQEMSDSDVDELKAAKEKLTRVHSPYSPRCMSRLHRHSREPRAQVLT